jgi:hypothetical protein
MNASTSYKYYKAWGSGRTKPAAFTVLSLVVSVNEGVVTDIAWDDGCYFCSDTDTSNPLYRDAVSKTPEASYGWMVPEKSTCKFNSYLTMTNSSAAWPSLGGRNCLKTHDQCMAAGCYNNATGTSCCDLKVYVAWQGSDAAGRHFTSSSKRFSRFRQYSISSLYDSALLLGESIAQSTVNTYNSITAEGSIKTETAGR